MKGRKGAVDPRIVMMIIIIAILLLYLRSIGWI